MTVGVGHGKKAARRIDAWLNDTQVTVAKHDVATFDALHPWYFGEAVPGAAGPVPNGPALGPFGPGHRRAEDRR